ncbi:MAG: DUF5659 domain-containing protein [Candidatus Aenigmarchaeota archaeon]|nr:DUF5659 domain-containing protein [Candidatus Aenigmarchaeota archaeon]
MSNTYRTNSLPLASFLNSATSVKFQGVDTTSTSVIYFLFEPQVEAQRLSTEYFSGRATCNPLELFKNYRVLKDLVFEAKRNITNNR